MLIWLNGVCTNLGPDFTSKLEHGLTFGTPKFYIAPYDKINHALVNLSYNCDVKSVLKQTVNYDKKSSIGIGRIMPYRMGDHQSEITQYYLVGVLNSPYI